jgi:hypothetical protein
VTLLLGAAPRPEANYGERWEVEEALASVRTIEAAEAGPHTGALFSSLKT